MFCERCGTENREGVNYCVGCGDRLPSVATPAPAAVAEPATPQVSGKKRKKLVKTLIIVFALLVILGAAAFFVIREVTFRNLGEDAVESVIGSDFETLFDQMHKDVLQAQYGGKSAREAAIDQLESSMEAYLKRVNNTVDEWELAYRATGVERRRGEELEALQEMYDDDFDCEVTAAIDVTVKLTAIMDGSTMSDSCLITLVKIDGEWYLEHDSAYYMSIVISQFLLYTSAAQAA